MSASGSKSAVLAALGANGGIAAMKFVAFAMTGSAALLAEAVHSVADTGNQALLLLGGHRAAREPNEEHPFGHGRERYFWAFVVAIVLFALGGLFALYEGFEKLRHPHPLEAPAWAIGTLLAAIACESFSFFVAIRVASPMRRGRPWSSFVRRSKDPEIAVVLLEDLGALLGLALALAGVFLALYVDPVFDGLATLAIGGLLFAIALVLMTEMKSLLIGESADSLVREEILAALRGTPEVETVIHSRTLQLGPEEILLAAKVALAPELDTGGVARAIDAAEARVRAAVPAVRWIFLEPDLLRSSRSATDHS